MCSVHFVHGAPTDEHPDPELLLRPQKLSSARTQRFQRLAAKTPATQHTSAAPPAAAHRRHQHWSYSNTPSNRLHSHRVAGAHVTEFARENHSLYAADSHTERPKLPNQVAAFVDSHDADLNKSSHPEVTSGDDFSQHHRQYFSSRIKPSVVAALKFIIFVLLAVIRKLRSKVNSLEDEVIALRAQLANPQTQADSDCDGVVESTDRSDSVWSPTSRMRKRQAAARKTQQRLKRCTTADVTLEGRDTTTTSTATTHLAVFKSGDTFFVLDKRSQPEQS